VTTMGFPVPLKVLLVDDDWRQMELRAYILSMAGFPVLTACGPVEALSLATTFEGIDVAVVDYEMPVMNGATLAERLKSKLANLNIVLYSAAIAIPSRDLQRVDTLISKCEGVTVLLAHLWGLSGRGCSEDNPLHDAREPPASVAPNRRSTTVSPNQCSLPNSIPERLI
jgi:CheY-like chemotaxis protein